RRRSYLITDTGLMALEEEYRRLMTLAADYRRVTGKRGPLDEN
ncbi:MAG: PadR family transcriptional regulator, partial [Clostridiales bacterium]|nr:PadR family transcriptional regulator [Clostridiales bacterium]